MPCHGCNSARGTKGKRKKVKGKNLSAINSLQHFEETRLFRLLSLPLPFAFYLSPLTRRLKKHHPRGDRDIQAPNPPVHRDRYKPVAAFAD